jgi:hypothetical protein
VNGSLSVRFDAVLDDNEPGLFGVWSPHPASGRTYGALEYSGASPRAAIERRFPGARVSEPALCVLEIEPAHPAACERLREALAGPGGLGGVIDARVCEGRLVLLELDETRTELSLVVDLIDATLGAVAPGRVIRPLLGLRDETLAAFAAATLGASEIDRTRLIETYLEPLLAGSRAAS